jgi:hypothetical protein
MIYDDRKDVQYREVLGAPPPELVLYVPGSPLPVPMGVVAVVLGGIPAHGEVDDITSGQARPFKRAEQADVVLEYVQSRLESLRWSSKSEKWSLGDISSMAMVVDLNGGAWNREEIGSRDQTRLKMDRRVLYEDDNISHVPLPFSSRLNLSAWIGGRDSRNGIQ